MGPHRPGSRPPHGVGLGRGDPPDPDRVQPPGIANFSRGPRRLTFDAAVGRLAGRAQPGPAMAQAAPGPAPLKAGAGRRPGAGIRPRRRLSPRGRTVAAGPGFGQVRLRPTSSVIRGRGPVQRAAAYPAAASSGVIRCGMSMHSTRHPRASRPGSPQKWRHAASGPRRPPSASDSRGVNRQPHAAQVSTNDSSRWRARGYGVSPTGSNSYSFIVLQGWRL